MPESVLESHLLLMKGDVSRAGVGDVKVPEVEMRIDTGCSRTVKI